MCDFAACVCVYLLVGWVEREKVWQWFVSYSVVDWGIGLSDKIQLSVRSGVRVRANVSNGL